MRLNVLVGDALGGEVAQVDLALLGLGLLAGDLLALDDVGLLGGGRLDAGAVLEQDEGEPSRSPGVGISLQIDVLDLAKLAEILLDVCVFRLLKIFYVLEKISKTSKHLIWQQSAVCCECEFFNGFQFTWGRPPTNSFLSSSWIGFCSAAILDVSVVFQN